MKNTIIMKSTSNVSASTSDILLRENSNFKLVFRPVVIDNEKQSEACVKGWFVFQRKNSDGTWEDFVDQDLYGSRLKSGEGLKLELKSEEVLILLNNLSNLRKIYEKYGILYGELEFVITKKNLKSVLEQILKFDDLEKIKALSQLTPQELASLTQNISQTKLQKLLGEWNDSSELMKSNEKYWQNLFKKYSWVISQIFTCPYTLFGRECYYGGKNINNKGGVVGDFLYKSEITNNIGFIELKTPSTNLVGSQYRGDNPSDMNSIFSISEKLSGSVNQLLNQRLTFIQKKDSLNNSLNIHNSKAILIAGSLASLDENKKKSFELYRSSLSDIEIITFDELKRRIEALIDLYK